MDDLKLYAKNEKSLQSLVQTVQIFSDDIGTEFGMDRCYKVWWNFIAWWKSNERINYKYLGTLKADQI